MNVMGNSSGRVRSWDQLLGHHFPTLKHLFLRAACGPSSGMKGMGKAGCWRDWADSARNIFVVEMESRPKRNLLPRCLKCKCLTEVNQQSAQLQTKPKQNLLPKCLKSWLTSGQCSLHIPFIPGMHRQFAKGGQ